MTMSEQEKKAFAYWRKNPVEAIKDWFKVTPEDYQAEIIHDCFVGDHDRVAGKSGHGVGKSTTLAWAGWLFLNLYPMSRVVATAPTFAQLHDVLWPEYAKWKVHMPEALGQQWDISGNHIRHKKHDKVWFAVSRTSNKPANLQGFHGSDIMVQGDEASAIPPDVFEVIEGIMSNAETDGETAKLLLMGNPNFNAGEFYNAFHKNKELYHRYTISGDEAIYSLLGHKTEGEETIPLHHGEEHEQHGKVFYSKRVTKKYCDLMAKKYGAGSGVYDVRVRGIFPREEDMAVIPLTWAQRAAAKELPMFDNIAHPVTLVMDVARQGADETVLSAFRNGHEVKKQVWAKTTTEQCVDHLLDAHIYWKALGIAVARVVIDEPGVGGGVIDSARRNGVNVSPYHGGEGLKQGKDPETDIRMFANRRARDYWHVRRMFETGEVSILDDEDTVNQLASIHYDYNERDKIVIESKQKMRDRLGDDASPDRADAIVMGLAPWYSFKNTNAIVAETDIVYGGDREAADMDLF